MFLARFGFINVLSTWLIFLNGFQNLDNFNQKQ